MSRRNNRQAMMSHHKYLSPEKRKAANERLFRSLKPLLPSFLIAAFFIVVTVVIAITAPQILKDLTNEIATPKNGSSIDLAYIGEKGMIMAILYVASALSSAIANILLTTLAQRYSKSLRSQITEKINRLPLSYFDKTQFGDILSRLTNDVDTMGQSLEQSLGGLFQSVFQILGVLIAMFITAWQIAFIVVASLPLMLLGVFVFNGMAMPRFRKRSHVLGEAEAIAEESYGGQLIIKAFGAEKRSIAKFEKKNKELEHAMFGAQFFGGFMQPLNNFISYLAYAAVCITAGLLMNSGEAGMSFGTISAFLVYVNLFQSPMGQIAQSINSLQSGFAASARVFDFLGEEELSSEEGVERKLLTSENSTIQGEVRFEHIDFSYDPSRQIIHDWSADVKPGMKVALVGPTGAGKTTMVNLLMRFYEVDKGSIKIDGISSKDMPREEVHDIFGMVLQDTWLFEGSVRENLVYNSKNVSDEDIYKVLRDVDLEHYIRTLPGGLDYVITDANAISSGEKQLLTIARAMLKKSPLLILDEATSNVDTRTEERIQKAMDKLMEGRTSFVIAHRLSTIRNADLILVMKDGAIIEQGNHDALMGQNGFYAGLYNAQFAFE